ncbi:MAG: hypothetical protein P4L33_08510 [Capsulimonadaceae bacterium]|nr:hypothetical protein [Capsulimonadaceae bacterium]
MNIKAILTLAVAMTAIVIGFFAHHSANAQQPASAPITFTDKPAEHRNGDFRITAARFADTPRGRIYDGRVTIETFHSKPVLMVTATKDGLKFSEIGKIGTPSSLMPFATMQFDKDSMTVELKSGVTTFRDGKGRSAAIYGFGAKPERPQ